MAYQARIILKSKYELNTSMIPTKIIASNVVSFLLTNSPINVLSLVIIKRGIMGIGIMILSITWLQTRILRGSRPSRIAIVVGITLINRVTNRLSQRFTFFPKRPSIIAWPASVPTTDDAIPEDRRVSKKTIPAVAPNKGNKVLYASDIEATPGL